MRFADSPIREFLVSQYEGRAELGRLAGANFEVDGCNECGLVYQRTTPDGSLLSDIYDRWIPGSERERLREKRGLGDYRYLADQVDLMIRIVGSKPCNVSVLDFGLGWSEWASIARAFGCNVSGTELSIERIAYAKSIGIRVLDWNEIPGQQFHFINTEQVFEHLIEPRQTLEHLVRGMHADGLIKISVPDGRGILKRLKHIAGMTSVTRDYIMPIQPLEHVNCFDYSSLVALGRQVGLRPVQPSLWHVYSAASGWFEPRQAARNLLRPIYRHVYPRSTFVYFARDRGS
jgi:hypothetical protein